MKKTIENWCSEARKKKQEANGKKKKKKKMFALFVQSSVAICFFINKFSFVKSFLFSVNKFHKIII